MHRTVNPVCDGDSAAEGACILDFNGDVNEAVAIKVAELIGWIQSGREPEALIETRCAQRAIRPERDAPKRRRRELGTGYDSVEDQGSGEQNLGHHIFCTRSYRTALLRLIPLLASQRGRGWAAPNGMRLSCGADTRARRDN